MQVDSYLEIFTTMYGWGFSRVITEVATSTGIVLLPFLFMLISAWKEHHGRSDENTSIVGLIKGLEVRLISALFVLVTCVQASSITSLNNLDLSYTAPNSSLSPSPVTVSRDTGGTGTTMDAAMADAASSGGVKVDNPANVPAWWYTVMAISSGVNNAVRDGINSNMQDFRTLENMARSAAIEDPKLRAAVQRFNGECFLPALSLFQRGDIPASSAGQTVLDSPEYGKTDVEWMGSQFFRTEAGYYDTLRAKDPVAGFPINYARDTEIYNPATAEPGIEPGYIPDWGRPTCREWWESPSAGIRAALVKEVGDADQFAQKIGQVFTFRSQDQGNDAIAKIALSNVKQTYSSAQNVVGDQWSAMTSLGRGLTLPFADVAILMKGFEAQTAVYPLITLLTMLQPLLLMALYMFLPLYIIISAFDLKAMMLGGLALFTVKFWTVMWFIARWMDDRLIAAMYPTTSVSNSIDFLTSLGTSIPTAIDDGMKRTVLNILLVLMFIGLPMVWSALMAMAGYRIGGGIDGMLMSANKTGEGVGKTGGSIATKAIKR